MLNNLDNSSLLTIKIRFTIIFSALVIGFLLFDLVTFNR
jgi:hypothetical protein